VDRAYVLHTYPYRETSLILQVWTEKHGRMGLVAKGARRPKSPQRTVLIPFQPLAIDWFGRGELRTLKSAEPAAPATPLAGQGLLSAFYLNELLLKLTTRDDPHEGLFDAYDQAITALRSMSRTVIPAEAGIQPKGIEPILRRFELKLLHELGYAVELARVADTHAPINPDRDYWYVAGRGPLLAGEGEAPAYAVKVSGLTLLDLQRGEIEAASTVAQAKRLMRLLINHSLDGKELATRALVKDLQRLDEEP
jgi:DNA repair protein RecO (recombination protein O)